jgi:atypical dual specificity phosphatase
VPTNYSNLWWLIPNALAGMGMPFVDPLRRLNLGGSLHGYADDLPILWEHGIRAVVCLLNIPSDEGIFRMAGFDFKCLPIADGCAPNLDQAKDFISFVEISHSKTKAVAVFCEAGLGRTGTILATYLIHAGKTANEAITSVRAIEPSAIETVRQVKFLEEFETITRRKLLG